LLATITLTETIYYIVLTVTRVVFHRLPVSMHATVHSRYTRRSSALPGGPLGIFHPSLTTKA